MKLNPKESSIEKTQVTQEEDQTIKIKDYCHLKQLESIYNLNATRIVHCVEKGRGYHPRSSQYCIVYWNYTS
jgi:hypothetical protein